MHNYCWRWKKNSWIKDKELDMVTLLKFGTLLAPKKHRQTGWTKHSDQGLPCLLLWAPALITNMLFEKVNRKGTWLQHTLPECQPNHPHHHPYGYIWKHPYILSFTFPATLVEHFAGIKNHYHWTSYTGYLEIFFTILTFSLLGRTFAIWKQFRPRTSLTKMWGWSGFKLVSTDGIPIMSADDKNSSKIFTQHAKS